MEKRKMSTFERLSTGRMNRAQRRELGRRVVASDPGLTVVHPNAGGIDVGNESHFVSVPAERDTNPVREFGCWTAALNEMAEWLKACRIDTVAMDRAVRHSRTARHPGGTGERTAHEKCPGSKDRCAGMSVADETAHIRTDARFVPATAGYGIRADDLAGAGPAR